jgi:hypothetical protein
VAVQTLLIDPFLASQNNCKFANDSVHSYTHCSNRQSAHMKMGTRSVLFIHLKMNCADQADRAPFACQKHLKTLSLSRDKTISSLLSSTTESISAMDCRKESSHLSMTFYLYPWLPIENYRISLVSLYVLNLKDRYSLRF